MEKAAKTTSVQKMRAYKVDEIDGRRVGEIEQQFFVKRCVLAVFCLAHKVGEINPRKAVRN